ncbi:MAG: DUF2750 domain-containing protein [Bryobacterales bacterium]|nr:DUF2750 domain-containing protein [Bryobacterales bacterium]
MEFHSQGSSRQVRLYKEDFQTVKDLDGSARYEHFVKHIADCEEAWGLYDDGWAMGEDDEGNATFQLWPAKEYAALCADGEWAGYEAAAIPLEDLRAEMSRYT